MSNSSCTLYLLQQNCVCLQSEYVTANLVSELSAVLTASGESVEGKNFSLTCDVKGDELLQVNKTQFQWDRVGGSMNISQSATLTFSPLMRDNIDSEYRCTATITSPLLPNMTHSVSNMTTITIMRKWM